MHIPLLSVYTRLFNKTSVVLFLLISSFYANAQRTDKPDWRESGNNKGFTFYEVQQDFYQFWQGKTPKKGQGYKVFKRWENFMKPRVYPSGNLALPSTTYERFMEWQRNRPVSFRSPVANWTELGPFAKPTGYDAGKGRVDFVRFDPNNPTTTMYVGAPDGGLWKTTNGGASWTTNNDFLTVIGCADLAIDPTNTQIMYLATGNWENDRRSIGVLKSTNGGSTWNTTSLTWTALDNYKIRKLLMDPSDPDIMMVVTDGGIFRTNDGWVSYTNPYCCNTLYDIEFKPGNSNIVYAIGKDFLKSIDNGVTWTPITTGLPAPANVSRAMLGVSEDNPAYVYALFGDNDGGYLGTYRSTNSGVSFSIRSSSPNLLNSDKSGGGTGGQASHDLAIAVSPVDAELVTVGGINQWQSEDGGVQWDLVSYWLGNDVNYPGEGDASPDYVHADVQAIEYQQGSSTTMFATCDGGISKSTNGGLNWTDISVDLRIAQQTGIALSADLPNIMVTGLQDIGTLKNTNGAWSVINGGDGESAFIDYTDNNYIVTSNPNGAHALSMDGGLTRDDITGLPPGTEFFSPISQDPNFPFAALAGGRNKLWKSLTLLSGGPYTWLEMPGTLAGTGGILRFEVAPSDVTSNTIYAIKYDAISKTVNGGTTWANITGTLPVANASLTNLAVSNTDADNVWVTFSGYSDGEKVFKTVDGGTTWTNVSTGLPNIPMNTIVYRNGTLNDEVYVGADIGVYYLDNTLSAWTQFFMNTLPNCAVTDLEIFYPTGKLRASTYGRGAWETDLFSVLPVELLSFQVQLKDKNTGLLTWSTASEINNKGFEIQWMHGRNGTFEPTGFVEAKGGNGQNTYSFEQKNLVPGEHYFRLKQIDNDGSFEFSPAKSLLVQVPFTVRISPNPVQNELIVNVLIEEKATFSISLANAAGQVTELQRSREIPKGNTEFRFDLSNYPAGVYFCIFKTGKGGEETVRIVKK